MKRNSFFAFQPGNACVFVGETKKGCQLFLTNSHLLKIASEYNKIQKVGSSFTIFLEYKIAQENTTNWQLFTLSGVLGGAPS